MTRQPSPVLPPDYHTHTWLCHHADGEPLDYAAYASKHGLKGIACTDHCPTDDGYDTRHRMLPSDFEVYRTMVETAQKESDLPVLLGIEADYYPGCDGFLRPFLEQHPFDIVLGSVHFRNFWSEDPQQRGLGDHPKPELVWSEYFTLISQMARTGLYDVASHLDLPKKFGNPIDDSCLREFALPALDDIAAAGMAIEINTSGGIHGVGAYYPSLLILGWAAEREIGLTFGSDSHQPKRVGDGFWEAIALARQAGFTAYREYDARKPVSRPLPQ